MYIYITNAPQDKVFVQRLSRDLEGASIPHWYNNGQASEEVQFLHLHRATHVVVALSPAVLLDEHVLAALEHARQHKLERIALRVAPMDTLPPQIQGVLPLDFSSDEAYQENLDTLMLDLRDVDAPRPELPEDLLKDIYSENVNTRQTAVETLGQYRTNSDTLRDLARSELEAMFWRERDSRIKSLIQVTLKSFDLEARPETPPVAPPSKEELEKQAEGRAVIIKDKKVAYLWESARWHFILGGLAFFLGLILFLGAEGNWLYWLPMVVLGLSLPEINVRIRQGGQYTWEMPGPVIGNVVISLLIVGVVGVILLVLEAFTPLGLVINLLVSMVYGVVAGWLSSISFEVPA